MNNVLRAPLPHQKHSYRLRLFLTAILVGMCFLIGWLMMIKMPSKSHRGLLPPLTPVELQLKAELSKDLIVLAQDIGERNLDRYANLKRAARFLEKNFRDSGYTVSLQEFDVDSKSCHNVIAELPGGDKSDEIIVVGAHYDSLYGTVGANDNGTGVVALLSMARACSGVSVRRTIRFVGFVNEEPPYFQTENMGSWVYAKSCRRNNDVVMAMMSLETIGYYSDKQSSQRYPPPFNLFYPSIGNFIAFVGNVKSRGLLKKSIKLFRSQVEFPSEGIATFEFIPGIGWSDHWAFWQEGYPGIMVTDTAPFRYPYYHTHDDRVNKIDFDRLARVVSGLNRVILRLANE